MSPFLLHRRHLTSNDFEIPMEDAVLWAEDLRELDGETTLLRRDGHVETGLSDIFEREA